MEGKKEGREDFCLPKVEGMEGYDISLFCETRNEAWVLFESRNLKKIGVVEMNSFTSQFRM